MAGNSLRISPFIVWSFSYVGGLGPRNPFLTKEAIQTRSISLSGPFRRL